MGATGCAALGAVHQGWRRDSPLGVPVSGGAGMGQVVAAEGTWIARGKTSVQTWNVA